MSVCKHRWHNGWDAETHQTVWSCSRCGLLGTEIDRVPDVWGAGGNGGL